MNKPIVRLSGQDGNVFMILGLCARAARKAKWSQEQIKEFQTAAMNSSSYDEVLCLVMDKFEVE